MLRNSTPRALQIGDRLDDVVGRERTMLHAFAIVEIEIFFDLRFLFPFGRLVDREFHKAVAVAHDLAHESGVFGRDILVVEGEDVAEAHHILVELDPRIHLVPSDVADTMIDIEQSGFGRIVGRLPFPKAWHEDAVVILALDEEMDRLAVSVDAAHDDFAVFVLQRLSAPDNSCRRAWSFPSRRKWRLPPAAPAP